MDELKDLKQYLDGENNSKVFQQDLSSQQIKILIEEKTKNYLSRIRKKFFVDFVIGILVLSVTTYFLWTKLDLDKALIMIGLVVLPVLIIYIYMHNRTRKIQVSGKELKTALEDAEKNIISIKKIYLRTAIFGFPIIYFTIYFLIKSTKNTLLEFTSSDVNLIVIGLLFTLIIPIIVRKIILAITERTLREIQQDLEVLKEIN